ncbi:type II/IV secretion system protein [Candidatus Peregrinibacteria bacterium]|jgi:type IV pilus assembly protein PilB|nr:type II/IV secretion system protein [Candidatus Peregrinibacteria bacterium]MBT7736394.1 type II/IV secretion system protein [Candidatus Peregrinibacteria bacterium]
MAIDQAILAKALVEKGIVKEKTLKSLVDHAKTQNITLEQALFEREIIPDEKLGAVIAEMYESPFVKVSDKVIPEPLLHVVPYALASHQLVIPFEKNAMELKVATNDPQNFELLGALEKKTGLTISAHYATEKDIKASLKAYNKDVNEKFNKLLKGALEDPTKIESLKDAAKILDTIILFAFQNNASDIHIEPHKEFVIVRYRVDGMLQTIAELPIAVIDLLTTRVKVLASLRTDEHRAAQDGRFKIELENNEITLRVSILPTYDGEKTVMRLLTSTNQELDLESLGYSAKNLDIVKRDILKTNGILLVTGPTGSGKTTTLYSILKLLNSPEVNISTIEDPIEYRLEGVNQIQVNNKAHLTFAAGLRSLLRQDPDIIMVGEIRDEETADIAVNAALTGHLVLATLHTNDAASTLPRMAEMGVEPFLLGATAKMVLAQRLIRTICSKCKVEYKVKMDQINEIAKKQSFTKDLEQIIEYLIKVKPELEGKVVDNTITLYKGEGCGTCGNTGYKGRLSIAEVMEVSDGIRKILLENGSSKDIEDQAIKEGVITMFQDGLEKVIAGKTTLEEILRVMRT